MHSWAHGLRDSRAQKLVTPNYLPSLTVFSRKDQLILEINWEDLVLSNCLEAFDQQLFPREIVNPCRQRYSG